MRIADSSVPVVVLKLVEYGPLGVVRSLGRLGVRVYGIDPDASSPGLTSRYCAGKFIWDVEHAPAEQTLEFILGVTHKLGARPILIPVGDSPSLFVFDHQQVLSEHFLFPMPPRELVHTLYDKKEMYFLAKKLGIPTPETAFPQCKQELAGFLDQAVFPVVLKGIDADRLQKRAKVRMVIVGDKQELLEKYEALEDPEQPNLMLQEYIPGGEDSVWMFNGYFNDRSECLFGLTGKKIRQAPVYTGMTSLGICLKNDVVDRTTREFMKAVGYKGILDIGYRYDARDGQYKVLDINPRLGVSFRLFVASNGMDVARALYLDLTGQHVPSSMIQEGRKWVVEDKDFHSYRDYRRDGRITASQWLGSFRGVREGAYFAWDDPVPFLRRAGLFAKQSLQFVGKKLRRA
jgi:D-aspartate ligase